MARKRAITEMGWVLVLSIVSFGLFVTSLVPTGLYWAEYKGESVTKTIDGEKITFKMTGSTYKSLFDFKQDGGLNDVIAYANKDHSLIGDEDGDWCESATDGNDSGDQCCGTYSAVQGLMITATVMSFLTCAHYLLYSFRGLEKLLGGWLKFSDDTIKNFENTLVIAPPVLAAAFGIISLALWGSILNTVACGDKDSLSPDVALSLDDLYETAVYQEGFWLAVAATALNLIISIVLGVRTHHHEDIEDASVGRRSVTPEGTAEGNTALKHVANLVF
tara:strand:+ start:1759 stop:2586 length:828 start_codon:yes stop_codon:yes gene_type:complete